MRPLFKLVGKTFSDEWVQSILVVDEKLAKVSSDVSQIISTTVCDVQQRLLLILKDISTSLVNRLPLKVCGWCNFRSL